VPLSQQNNSENTTHAGHLTAILNAADIVAPFPYPRVLYIVGAKRGKARACRQETTVWGVEGQ
jgi:hypothetical protein